MIETKVTQTEIGELAREDMMVYTKRIGKTSRKINYSEESEDPVEE